MGAVALGKLAYKQVGKLGASACYTREEVESAINRQIGTQKRLTSNAPDMAVLQGTNWIFNPAPPLSPALVAKLARYFPADLPYCACIREVVDAYIDAHVGQPKKNNNKGPLSLENIFMRNQRVVEDTLDALNAQLEASQVRFAAECGAQETAITDLRIKIRGGKGRKVRSNQTMKKSVKMETTIYVIFDGWDEGSALPMVVAEAAAPSPAPKSAATKIKELKDLLDCGALTQEEFDASKAKLLEAMLA